MLYPDRATLATQDTLQVHQTTHISTGNYFSTIAAVVGQPVFAHTYTYRFFGHTKRTTKTTTFVYPG